ncbi:hypothetical protein [Gordonia alkanivorans]|uniref:hypothetical protein n=1 Tax=Gordonia alkanivorans TaxID=84096 RepID=UPI0018DD8375|nr:hypothetical protein [Gordonia alkanivorans]
MTEQSNTPSSWRLIRYEDAHVESSGSQFFSYLIVSGVAAYANIRVELMPLVYIDVPDYWGIEVVGSVSFVALPAITPYEVRLPLDRAMGRKGIEVIGADGQSMRIDVTFEDRLNPDDGANLDLLHTKSGRTLGGRTLGGRTERIDTAIDDEA